MTETTWVVSSVEELKGVAGELLGLWKQSNNIGDEAVVVALSGDLGAGKTTFVQQLAQILGVEETVTSPTFVIMKSYETTDTVFERLVHMDAYRIEDDSELAPLNFSDILTKPNTLLCIEWAERISAFLPQHTIKMDLESLPHGKHQLTYYAD
jgi:tRNA threonylcarbamoyladenosine biosynthesis protein TsaE